MGIFETMGENARRAHDEYIAKQKVKIQQMKNGQQQF